MLNIKLIFDIFTNLILILKIEILKILLNDHLAKKRKKWSFVEMECKKLSFVITSQV